MRKIGVIFLLLLAITAIVATSAFAAGESWTVSTVDTIGCGNGATTFSTWVSGIASFPTNLRFHTTVDAGGLRYMDEDAGTPGDNEYYGWGLYDSSTGGPTTAMFPIAPDTPITVVLTLIDGVGGPAVSTTIVYITQCNGGTATIVNNVPNTATACPYPMPADAVLAQLPAGAPAFFAADLGSATGFNIPAGSWYMSDFGADFVQVWIACQAQPVYVPANAVLG